MSLKWIGFVTFVWIILLFLGSTFEKQTTLAGTWEAGEGETALEYLVNVKNITYADAETGKLAWLTPNPEYFVKLAQVLTWDFSFLKCPADDPITPTIDESRCGYEMIRWIVFVPFTVAVLFGLIITFVQLLQGFIN